MSRLGKILPVLVLIALAYVFVPGDALPAKIQYTTPADDMRAYKLMNVPPNTTGSCKSRYGEGALAGKYDCVCMGGYEWNADKTQCVSDGTPQGISYVDRLRMRILRRFGVEDWDYALSSSAASSVADRSSSSAATLSRSSSSKPKGCYVKALVSRSGEKTYLIPGCKAFDETKVDASRKERVFCSEEVAVNAGWTKSKDCPS